MDAVWIGIIVTAVGVAATVGIGWWQVRKANPKRQISYAVEVTPLLADAAARDAVQVAVAGEALKNPHIVRLSVRSDSRVDIASDSFDQQKALAFDFGSPVQTLVDAEWSGIRLTIGRGNVLEMEPQLIKPGDRASVSVIVDGAPEDIKVSKTLIDTKIVQSDNDTSMGMQELVGLGSPVVAATATLAATTTVFVGRGMDLTDVISLVIMLALAGLFVLGFIVRLLLRGRRIVLKLQQPKQPQSAR